MNKLWILIFLILFILISVSYYKYTYRWISIDGYKDIKVLRSSNYNSDFVAAKLIHKLNSNTQKLIDTLVLKYGKSDPKVRKLLREFDYTDIEESTTTYIYDKGDFIKLKVRKADGTLYDENFMMYVLLHELAHIITNKKFKTHGEEFNNNYEWLLSEASKKSLVIPEFIQDNLKRNYLHK